MDELRFDETGQKPEQTMPWNPEERKAFEGSMDVEQIANYDPVYVSSLGIGKGDAEIYLFYIVDEVDGTYRGYHSLYLDKTGRSDVFIYIYDENTLEVKSIVLDQPNREELLSSLLFSNGAAEAAQRHLQTAEQTIDYVVSLFKKYTTQAITQQSLEA